MIYIYITICFINIPRLQRPSCGVSWFRRFDHPKDLKNDIFSAMRAEGLSCNEAPPEIGPKNGRVRRFPAPRHGKKHQKRWGKPDVSSLSTDYSESLGI